MTKTTKDIATIITIIVLLIFLIGIGPLITIWSINTLVATQIAYTFWTWLAMVWAQMVTFGGVMTAVNRVSNKL